MDLPGIPRFQIFAAVYDDLDPSDPLRSAVLVHVMGETGQRCYEAVAASSSTYVIGRGSIPGGRFFTAAQLDFAALRAALIPFWPAMPLAVPRVSFPAGQRRTVYSQEIDDVRNYTGCPPAPGPYIRPEARLRLPLVVPARHVQAAINVCAWLTENMRPERNCYTLSALLTRWLHSRDIPAVMQTGQLVFNDGKDRHSIQHCWVDVGGHILDLTVNHQSWDDLRIARIVVDDSRLRYQPGAPDPAHELAATWRTGSKPTDRPPYTRASLKRQTALIREIMPLISTNSALAGCARCALGVL